ncbi:MAG: UvrD-helicase domain-containing protein [Deltaproteobacteria bacterium]|nr:UvrD-helicase domain-containing protein [Deltaproteobacteria bacterium]
MKPELGDSRERSMALDTGASYHVESPAGSGKTLLLTMRFLKLLGEVDHPRDIIALTFTEKAAGEMQGRIQTFLRRAEEVHETTDTDLPDSLLLEYAARALEKHYERKDVLLSSKGLNVMTFHGFCSYLVSHAPLEAGIVPGFDISADQDQPLLLEESVRKTSNRLFALPSGDVTRRAFTNRLLHYNNNWSALAAELKDIISQRDKFTDLVRALREAGYGNRDALTSIIRERLAGYLEERLSGLAADFAKKEPGSQWPRFIADLASNDAENASVFPSRLPGSSWENLPAWRSIAASLLTKDGRPRRTFGPKSGFYSGFGKTAWAKAITGMPPKTAALLQATRFYPAMDDMPVNMNDLDDFIILAAEVIGDYESLCGSRHCIDFVGLEQAALRVLNESDPSELHLYLDHRIQHLLVDEFQDTSRNQWDLIQRLCSGWGPGDGRTVFIVGDPKQSIYAFRNAEVALFYEALKGIPLPGRGSIPLESLLLRTNFRSTGKLIEWTNGLFGEEVMREPRVEADEVSFSPGSPVKQGTADTTLSLNLFVRDEKERAKTDEALWLAGRIGQVVTETGGERSIGILLFTRTRLTVYLRALKQAGIPVRVQEGLLLKERPEVAHLMQMARLLVKPHDDLAWASLLRSPWSWYDTAALLETALEAPESWREKIAEASGKLPGLSIVEDAVDRAYRRIGRDHLGVIVRKMWEELDGPARTASRYDMAGIANCRRFLELLDEAERGIPLETLNRVETLLDFHYEPEDPTTARSPVQLMTIHRAKGLEFDIVFLPFLDWNPLSGESRHAPPYLLERIPGTKGERLIAMSPDRRIDQPSLFYNLLRNIRKERKIGEARRWFYVAVTRARESLYLSGVTTLKEGAFKAGTQNPLGWIMNYQGMTGKTAADVAGVSASGLEIAVNPPCEAPALAKRSFRPELPAPYPLTPEKIPCMIENPSSGAFDDDEARPVEAESPKAGLSDRVRGTVIHRLMQRGIETGGLPGEVAVRSALRLEGLSATQASSMAADILQEARRSFEDPFLSDLTGGGHPVVRCEWSLEDRKTDERIRSGTIDLTVFDGTSWWVIDFKTSRPAAGQGAEEFMDEELRRYRSQLEDYQAMLSRFEGIDRSVVTCGLYFTALKKWKELS